MMGSEVFKKFKQIDDLLLELQIARQDEANKQIKGLIRKTMNLIRKNRSVIAHNVKEDCDTSTC
jgi:hypothetical protein